MSKASLDFINSGKCYPSEVLNYVLELEQQITELKESQKQKQIIRLCQRLDKAEQQNKELIEDLIEYIKAVYSVSGLINIKSKNLIESVTGKPIDELLK